MEYCDNCGKPKTSWRNLIFQRGLILAGCSGTVVISSILGASILPMIGFGSAGVTAGSLAAYWQSSMPFVAAGSPFAVLQSLGATGSGSLLFGGFGFAGGSAAALAILRSTYCRTKKFLYL